MVLGDLPKKKKKLDHQLIPYTKINLRWKKTYIKDVTLKKSYRNIGRKISDIPCSNIFANTSPRARDVKKIINKQDYIKWKGFSTAKENINKMERELTIWVNILANDTSDKGLISKIYEELI